MNKLRSFAAVIVLACGASSGVASAETITIDFDTRDALYDYQPVTPYPSWGGYSAEHPHQSFLKWEGRLDIDGVPSTSVLSHRYKAEFAFIGGWKTGQDFSVIYNDGSHSGEVIRFLTNTYWAIPMPNTDPNRLDDYPLGSHGADLDFIYVTPTPVTYFSIGDGNWEVDLDESWVMYQDRKVMLNSFGFTSEFVLHDVYIDSVHLVYSVTTVPEPETYAMLLLGLGVVGVIARRRRLLALNLG
jgi:hypothetical protein